jgi:hypothetical protein
VVARDGRKPKSKIARLDPACRIATGLEALVPFFIAMGLHFVVNDNGLRCHLTPLLTPLRALHAETPGNLEQGNPLI